MVVVAAAAAAAAAAGGGGGVGIVWGHGRYLMMWGSVAGGCLRAWNGRTHGQKSTFSSGCSLPEHICLRNVSAQLLREMRKRKEEESSGVKEKARQKTREAISIVRIENLGGGAPSAHAFSGSRYMPTERPSNSRFREMRSCAQHAARSQQFAPREKVHGVGVGLVHCVWVVWCAPQAWAQRTSRAER